MIEKLKGWAKLAVVYLVLALACALMVGFIIADLGFRWGP